MRNFLDVLRFELRLQGRSALFLAALAVFFLIHLLTITEVGINISDNDLVPYNSVHLIFRTELVLGIFGLLPAIIFVVNAATRDHALTTTELFYTTPVHRLAFLFGRFCAGTLCVLAVGLAGILGTMSGTFMPWLDAQRVAEFSMLPYVVCFFVLVVPNLVVFCTFSFCVAILSRTAAMSFAVALAFVVLSISVNTHATEGARDWLSLLDPFGGLAIEKAVRFWSVVKINTALPVEALPANRLLWLGLATFVLALTCWRFRLELKPATGAWFKARRQTTKPIAVVSPRALEGVVPCGTFKRRDTFAQLLSQLRMDLGAVLLSRLFWLVLLLAVVSIVSEIKGTVSPLMDLPIHPVTSHMLGFFRFALFPFALVVIILYAALLMHREREHGLHEIVDASPYPDWAMLASKVLTLCAVVLLLLFVSMLACIGLQAMAGHYEFQLGVYLHGLILNTGFYFCMLAVLACVLQTLVPGKWSGMLVVFGVLVLLLALPALGLEHVLYGFRIPYVVYSDMNGFGHFLPRTYSLMIYWGAFCILLMVMGHLLLPRGTEAGVRARLQEVGARFTPSMRLISRVAGVVFVVAGAWILYNTNILNAYQTAKSRLDKQADYERRYASYKKLPAASLTDVAMEVDLYPRERRLVSRGRTTLRNGRSVALQRVVVSADPRLAFERLELEGGTSALQDKTQGFFVFNLKQPLQPGAETQLTWIAQRHHRGFANSGDDTDIVANGTFVNVLTVMPIPVYDQERELTDNGQRRRRGLSPAPRLPALGDPAHLMTLESGVDGRLTYQVVFSTDADQIAVAPGRLHREWQHDGRRYFDYRMERPVWPRVSLSSARYQVARDHWNGVPLEIYHHAQHPWNVSTMLNTSKAALEYFSREFAPYMFSYFRIVEFPGYRDQAQAYPGTVPYSETVGFLTNLSTWATQDYATTHELSHMWWGGLAYGARMQGRKILNEGLAEYSALMLLKQQPNPVWVRRLLLRSHDAYLRSRKRERVAEQPVMFAEDQGYLVYGKASHVLFALQELLGTAKVHQALRNYLAKFADKPPPFPTSRDLVDELRAVAGPEYQRLITDLFEKIMLYDVKMDAVEVTSVGNEFDVTLDITARQFASDGVGRETEVPLDTWFQVALFPEPKQDVMDQTPLYEAFHRLRDGTQRITVRVPQRPGAAGVDPFHLMYDKTPKDHVRVVGR